MNAPEKTGYKESDPQFPENGRNFFPGNAESFHEIILRNSGGVPYHFSACQEGTAGYIYGAGSDIGDLFGIDPGSFGEKSYREMIEDFIPLEDGIPRDKDEARKRLFSGAIKNYRAIVNITTPGGIRKRLYEVAVPLTDPLTGICRGVSGFFFDTARWHSPAVNKPAKDDSLSTSDFLKNAFLRNISHEIRTPLNAIIGFSTILNDPVIDTASRKDYTSIIMRSADRLLETLDEIVEASLIESGDVKIIKEKININSEIREVYERLHSDAGEKGLRFTYTVPDEYNDVNIITDRLKVRKVLMNLVGNAIKFTEKGEVDFGYSVSGESVEFYVFDTGNGIPEECKGKIFDNFYQADPGLSRLYGGTGLGLSISKSYVEMLGGKIWFSSVHGKGTTFWFTIPFSRE